MGYQFHYTRYGSYPNGKTVGAALPMVLFLHGFLGSGRDFEPVLERLMERWTDRGCLTVDLPGHGKTIVTGDVRQYSMPQTAQALVAWLDELSIEQANLVGYSMGGRLALYLALHFPQRFPKVVLESASPGIADDRDRHGRLAHDWQLADQLEADFPAFLTNWYRQPLFAPLRQHPKFEQIMQQRSHNRSSELAKSLRYLSTGMQPSLWHGLAAHRQPLKLIVGADDRKFLTLNQQMSQLCPTAELTILPDCGHVVHLEQPAQFAKQVQIFLQ